MAISGMEGRPPSTNRPYIITVIVLAIVVCVAIVFALVGVGTKPRTTPVVNANAQGKVVGSTNTPPALEPSEVHSRSGTVVSVEKSGVTFSAPVYNDQTGIFDMKEIEARTDATTEYRAVDTTKASAPTGTGQPQPLTKTISRSELAKGSIVEVRSDDNMRTATKILATQIIKIR